MGVLRLRKLVRIDQKAVCGNISTGSEVEPDSNVEPVRLNLLTVLDSILEDNPSPKT
jgi:hypothetical protein